MARKNGKAKTQDRQFMDASSAPTAKQTDKKAKTFMDKQADEDRDDAKATHCNKGLKSCKDLLDQMSKAVAHGIATEHDGQKRACLAEVGDLGNAVRDTARQAVRDSKVEKRNLQPS